MWISDKTIQDSYWNLARLINTAFGNVKIGNKESLALFNISLILMLILIYNSLDILTHTG